MPKAHRCVPCRTGRAAGMALMCGLAVAGLAPAGLARNAVQWRLEANVPVICEILAVDTPVDRPASLAIATSCNAARFQLVLHEISAQAGLLAARSSAGPAAISGSAVTITSNQPGYALTTIKLAAPVDAERLSVTLLPI